MSTELTQSFIEMVKAYEAKPELEAQIKALGEDNALCYQTIDLKNSNIATLNAELAELRTKLAEVTKERDDASFRNLELDEKLSGIERLLGLAERVEQARKEEHQATIDAMTPKPDELAQVEQSIMITEPVPTPDWMKSEPDDIVASSGQSESLPTPSTSVSEAGSVENTTTSKDGIEPTPTPSDPRPINPYSGFPIHYPDGEYKGQPYYDKPSWVSWAAWCDAGGEAEPYMKNFG